MGLPEFKEENSSKIGITTPDTTEDIYITSIKAYLRIVCLSRKVIRGLLKLKSTDHAIKHISVLMFIMQNGYSSSRYIKDVLQFDLRTVSKCLDGLVGNGFVIIKYRRMFVVPFNAYRSIPTYVITQQGKTVLNKLLNY